MKNYNYKILLACLILVILHLHLLLYVSFVDHPYPIGDSWRYIRLHLEPLYAGDYEIGMLWGPLHPNPLRVVLLFVNAKFLDLNFKYELICGIIFRIIISIVLMYNFIKSQKKVSLCWTIVVLLLSLSFATSSQFTWSILATANIHYFLAIIYFLIFSKVINRYYGQNDVGYLLSVFAAYATIFIVLNKDIAILAICSTLFLTVIFYLSHRERFMLALWLIQGLVLMVAISLLKNISYYQSRNRISIIQAIEGFSQNIENFITTTLISVTSSFIPIMKYNANTLKLSSIVGICLLVVYLYYVVLYVIRKMWRYDVFPLCLIVFSSLFYLACCWNRYLPESGARWNSVPHRYFIAYQLAGIGLVWIVAALSSDRKAVVLNMTKVIVLLVCISIEGNFVVDRWKGLKYVNRSREIYTDKLYRQAAGQIPFEKYHRVYGYNNAYDDLVFLKNNNLSLFNKDEGHLVR
ncbi:MULTISPECIES: hypothetical protein [Desulfosediminicola]|uniref:hypothetical protein n=1 Tax=Desulfosediminicola TaxID=2886823 RepID=UPI0010AC2065|nr:hypothetical protein [Desulfosediminicola ganghwensis]